MAADILPPEPHPSLLCGPGWGRTLRRLLGATRPPFLTAAAMPVIVGTAWGAVAAPKFRVASALLALLAAVLVQAAANVLNDVGDDRVGTDARNAQRIFPYTGGSRFIQNGVMSAAQMQRWGLGLLGLALLPGIALITLHGGMVLWLGLVGAAFAWAYSLPPFLLASRGLGELSIAIAFGVLPVMGAAWLQTGHLEIATLLLSVPTGMWVTAILLINEVPDLEADAAAGKRTLPVRFGAGATVHIYRALHVTAFAALVAMVALRWLPAYVLLLPAVLLWLAWRASAAILSRESPPRALRAAIELTLRVHALGSLWVAGFALGRGGL